MGNKSPHGDLFFTCNKFNIAPQLYQVHGLTWNHNKHRKGHRYAER